MNGSQLFWSLVKIGGVAAVAITLAALLVWMERRFSALIQDRVGPTRANLGRFTIFGLLHPIADAIKILFKEDFVPAKANRLLHAAAPFLAMMPVLIGFAVIPFGGAACPEGFDPVTDPRYGPYIAQCVSATDPTQIIAPTRMMIADIDVGILFLFAIASLGVYGIAVAGWASYNNYALLGSLRASAQMISYEVSMGLNVMGILLLASSLRLDQIAGMQGLEMFGVVNKWGLFLQPFAFLLFFTAVTAETKRVPFDLPEGESEIQGGYMIEYSSSRFFMFFLGELVEIVAASSIMATLFFGGWATLPLPIGSLHYDHIQWVWGSSWYLSPLWMIIIQILSFLTKVFLLCMLQLTVRWTLPRFRYDQMMSLGWKFLLPLSLANLLGTALVAFWL